MSQDAPYPQAFDDEMLVAYLDGELPSEDVEAIERSLSSDNELQNRIDKLRITWDLLGELPHEQPNPNLAQSTIEMVSLALARENQPWLKSVTQNRWAMLLCGLLLAFATGVMAAQQRSRMKKQQLLSELPILVHYDQLDEIDSVQWLKKLSTIDTLVAIAEQPQVDVDVIEVPTANDERESWLQSLDPVTRANIAAHRPAYRQDTPERRAELKKIAESLHEPISTEPQTTLHYSTLLAAYTKILDQIGTVERTHLNAIDDLDERAAEVAKLAARERAISHAKHLSSADRSAFRNWNDELISTNWEFFSRWPDPDARVIDEIFSPIEDSWIKDEDLQPLRESLSNHAKLLLSALDPILQRDVLGVWLIHVSDRSSPTVVHSVEELRRRFERLPNEKKSELDFLSERDVRQKLSM
ncbi:MAG: hypothetical protein R3C53_25475 [Pirellulaceae bacterium]